MRFQTIIDFFAGIFGPILPEAEDILLRIFDLVNLLVNLLFGFIGG